VGAGELVKDTPDLEFTCRIHHPFLLSDNRHYTFYVWRRIFLVHPLVPYLLIPGYIVCAWIWFLRVGAYGCAASMLIEGYLWLPRARTNASTDPTPAFMHTSGSTSDTPVGASLLFDPLRVIARPACRRADMGFAVRGTLVWVNQLWNYVRLLVQGTGGRWAIHMVDLFSINILVPFWACEN